MILAYLLIGGGVCWIISEVLELVFGGRTGLTLALTAAFHLSLAGGIWAAYLGQGSRRSRVSGVAAGLASIGYLLLVYPPIACLVSPAVFLAIALTDGPALLGFAANTLLGSAFVAMGVLGRRTAR